MVLLLRAKNKDGGRPDKKFVILFCLVVAGLIQIIGSSNRVYYYSNFADNDCADKKIIFTNQPTTTTPYAYAVNPQVTPKIDLSDLVNTNRNPDCGDGLTLIQNTILSESITQELGVQSFVKFVNLEYFPRRLIVVCG